MPYTQMRSDSYNRVMRVCNQHTLDKIAEKYDDIVCEVKSKMTRYQSIKSSILWLLKDITLSSPSFVFYDIAEEYASDESKKELAMLRKVWHDIYFVIDENKGCYPESCIVFLDDLDMKIYLSVKEYCDSEGC